MSGLEIGPLHRGIAPKREGFQTFILDHGSKEALEAKYSASTRVDSTLIEEVDFVWEGQPYKELVKERRFDYIIASHVIEHTPDLIGFIKNCQDVLTDEGVISLVVPDMRYCFDYFRTPTDIGSVIDAHQQGRTRHTEGTMVSSTLNSSRNGQTHIWKLSESNNYRLAHEYDSVHRQLEKFRNTDGYFDMHAWCFTYCTFRLMIEDLNSLGYLDLKPIVHYPTVGCEFYVTLQKGKSQLSKEMRRRLKVQSQRELMKAWAK